MLQEQQCCYFPQLMSYFLPLLSYVVGGRLLNIFTEFYLLSSEPESSPAMQLTVDSAKWIGAWWLGFLIILALSYLCALILVRTPLF